MSHIVCNEQKLKARTSKIQGQVVALKTMLDEPHECATVLQQMAMIRGAVGGLVYRVTKSYLIEHTVHQGDEIEREEDLNATLKVLDPYIKQVSLMAHPFTGMSRQTTHSSRKTSQTHTADR